MHRTIPDARRAITQLATIASLRQLAPTKRTSLTLTELLRVAELQAARLTDLSPDHLGPAPIELIAQIPRIQIIYTPMPVSGSSHWNGHTWIIAINSDEPAHHQRFTLMHEFKHIIDHRHTHQLHRDTTSNHRSDWAEETADHFAACTLVPRHLLKRAWANGTQHITHLAGLFHVDDALISTRLRHIGLTPLPASLDQAVTALDHHRPPQNAALGDSHLDTPQQHQNRSFA